MIRRLLSFSCESDALAASLDEAIGETGVVIVPGGGQTRFGAHRGFALLGARLAEAGYPCLRYDRRGVGDSSGEDPGFAAAGPDLSAAVALLRRERPEIGRVVGFGLCDGATTLCLHAADAGLDGMILANPWVVEAEANEPPPAAIGRHYREQLTSWAGWKRLLTGGIDCRKALRGAWKLVRPHKSAGSLAERAAQTMAANPLPAHIVLAKDDATAIGFAHEWRRGALATLSGEDRYTIAEIDTDAHSFAHAGDFERLVESCLAAIRRFEDS
ncbi:MAG: hydrolase 1, exosortase A system-associated [Parasphingopyxis sp.]